MLRHVLPALGDAAVTRSDPGHGPGVARGAQDRDRADDARARLQPAPDDHEYRAGRRPTGSNPCRVRGAGSAKRARQIREASLAELETITLAVPPRYRLMVLLAAWCAMRFGELAELRRADVDVRACVVRVRRGVVRGRGGRVVKDPSPRRASGPWPSRRT